MQQTKYRVHAICATQNSYYPSPIEPLKMSGLKKGKIDNLEKPYDLNNYSTVFPGIN